MNDAGKLDALFREAVAAIDAGDIAAVERLTRDHPRLVRERLTSPGPWLRDKVGGALKGFFKKPYLLWFVAEDPVRNDTLPKNIAQVTQAIIAAAKRENVRTLQEQLDYALKLVAWSWVADRCGVQLQLIDTLIDAGASAQGVPESALVNGHAAAAERLIQRGADGTLATALYLGRWQDAERLAPSIDTREKQMVLSLLALRGKSEALVRLLRIGGVDISAPSKDLYAHATPLHHAVCSGSLDTVKVLVDAGASLQARDTAHGATPLGWAEHYVEEHAGKESSQRFTEIAQYLRARTT
ncbi:MAG TPA: ankyrin repeat domain-containing protein [Gemmatimonadaceae bacterium]|nr:ankyrin repeat domain-containing protein [Gemmatimonadaceae bacterium]